MGLTKQSKKKTGRGIKEQVVAEVSQNLEESNSVVFADYQGLTHKQLEELKKGLKKSDAVFAVTKNTLLAISLKNSAKFKDKFADISFEKPTATIFIKGDAVDPLKQLVKMSKEVGMPKIKFGLIDGQNYDEASIIKLSSLPSREVLLAQLLGTLQGPIYGLHRALNWNLSHFVMTLDAVVKAKPVEPAQPASTPTSDAQAETSEQAATTQPDQPTEAAEAKAADQPTTENPTQVQEGGDNNG